MRCPTAVGHGHTVAPTAARRAAVAPWPIGSPCPKTAVSTSNSARCRRPPPPGPPGTVELAAAAGRRWAEQLSRSRHHGALRSIVHHIGEVAIPAVDLALGVRAVAPPQQRGQEIVDNV